MIRVRGISRALLKEIKWTRAGGGEGRKEERGGNDDANAITEIAKCISALFIAIYMIYIHIYR